MAQRAGQRAAGGFAELEHQVEFARPGRLEVGHLQPGQAAAGAARVMQHDQHVEQRMAAGRALGCSSATSRSNG